MTLEIGEFVKVHLPGESPWAEVVTITDSGFIGRIDNKLFHEMSEIEQARFNKDQFGTVKPLPQLHKHCENDLVEFVRNEEHGIWQAIAAHLEAEKGD